MVRSSPPSFSDDGSCSSPTSASTLMTTTDASSLISVSAEELSIVVTSCPSDILILDLRSAEKYHAFHVRHSVCIGEALKQLTPHYHHQQQQQQQHRGSHSPTHPTHHQPQDTPLLCDQIEKKLVSAADRLLFKQRLFVPIYLVDSHPQSTRIRRMQRCFADSGCDSVPIHVLSCTLDVFRVTYPELMISSNSHALSNANSNSNSCPSLHSEKVLSAAHKRLFSSFSTSLVLHDFATEITPHIYLGCAQHAYSFQALKRHGVTHILNCARECVPYFPDSFTYYNLPLRDEESQDIVSVLDGACEFMEACRKQNGRVLVHCFAGVSRSAAIVAGYLMRSMGIGFEEVVQMLTSRRPIVDMNAGFRRQLESLRAVQHRADCSS